MTIRELADERSRGSLPLAEWGPVCAGCGGEEFRIDGYCSLECRDWHEDYLVADALRLLVDLADWVAGPGAHWTRGIANRFGDYKAGSLARHDLNGAEALLARFKELNEAAE